MKRWLSGRKRGEIVRKKDKTVGMGGRGSRWEKMVESGRLAETGAGGRWGQTAGREVLEDGREE